MRSYLYVPGDQPERLEKCLDRGADFVIIDLEDAVSPERKQIGRDTTGAWVAANSEHSAAPRQRPIQKEITSQLADRTGER